MKRERSLGKRFAQIAGKETLTHGGRRSFGEKGSLNHVAKKGKSPGEKGDSRKKGENTGMGIEVRGRKWKQEKGPFHKKGKKKQIP